MSRVLNVLLALPLAFCASVAHADLITETAFVGSSTNPVPIAAGTTTVNLPYFDASRGVLDSAYVVITGELVPSLYFPFQNLSQIPPYVASTINFAFGGGAVDTSGNPVSFSIVGLTEQVPVSTSGSITGTPEFIEAVKFLTPGSVTTQDGTGTFTVSTTGSTSIFQPPGFNATGEVDNTGFYGNVEVLYEYNIPEPPAAALLIVPLAALLLVRRRTTRAAPTR